MESTNGIWTCHSHLFNWSKGITSAFRYSQLMIWMEPSNHLDDCYFCGTDIKGFNNKTKGLIRYADVPSAKQPLLHGPNLPVPLPLTELPAVPEDLAAEVGSGYVGEEDPDQPHPLTQVLLDGLVRDLYLSKSNAELLGSRLKQSKLMAHGTTFAWYRNRDEEFRPFFDMKNDLVYCTKVQGLGVDYDANEWRLFIDSSKSSLKVVLLHNGNKYPSIPIAHSVILKERYEKSNTILSKIGYNAHDWQICGDLKIITMILGQQGGYTKYPCFLCHWNSRDRANHWFRKDWGDRTLVVGDQNVIAEALVQPKNILLPPLHIKLWIMKQFVKALPKDGKAFLYLGKKFPKLSEAKLREGKFTGPDIRRLLKDKVFEDETTEFQQQVWKSFRAVIEDFLGNTKSEKYEELVETLLVNLDMLGCKLSLKLHLLDSHLDYFPANLGSVSEEQGERFHQDIKVIEVQYHGRWDINMMADYCWLIDLKDNTVNNRKNAKVNFVAPTQ